MLGGSTRAGPRGEPVPTREKSLSILWLTNIPTPYTVPMWRELSQMCNLTIACLASSEQNRDWVVDTEGLNLHILGAKRIRLGHERVVYAPTLKLAHLFRKPPTIVIIDGWESPPALQVLVAARALRIPIVVSYWSTILTHRHTTGPVAAYRRFFFSQADRVLTPGRAATEAAIVCGVHPDRITTGIATIDVERFCARSPSQRTQGKSHSEHRSDLA